MLRNTGDLFSSFRACALHGNRYTGHERPVVEGDATLHHDTSNNGSPDFPAPVDSRQEHSSRFGKYDDTPYSPIPLRYAGCEEMSPQAALFSQGPLKNPR